MPRQPTEIHSIAPSGTLPNNPRLPVLVYRGVEPGEADAEHVAASFEQLFAAHGWPADWRDVIYPDTHYHTTAHEALGVARGSVEVQLGGEQGETLRLATGDVLVLPAGVAHRALSRSDDLMVIGAYPAGQDWDMHRPDDDPAAAQRRIATVGVPMQSPVGGWLRSLWPSSGDPS